MNILSRDQYTQHCYIEHTVAGITYTYTYQYEGDSL